MCICSMRPILQVNGASKVFTKKRLFGSPDHTRAVDKVTLDLNEGEVLVIAGESGSGKSTIAKMILGVLDIDEGTIHFDGVPIHKSPAAVRRACQMVHQDPYDSINPRMRVRDIVSEALGIHHMGDAKFRKDRAREVIREVKLDPSDVMGKYPHMLSGGQRQRVVLARALAVKPRIIIADEPVSMLDVSIRAELLDLMRDLQQKHNISFIYITHDLATARYFGQRIVILYKGRIMEEGPIGRVLDNPKHPYTRALISAISEPDPDNRLRMRQLLDWQE